MIYAVNMKEKDGAYTSVLLEATDVSDAFAFLGKEVKVQETFLGKEIEVQEIRQTNYDGYKITPRMIKRKETGTSATL